MTENPYRLARDIRGIGFKTADAIAGRLGGHRESRRNPSSVPGSLMRWSRRWTKATAVCPPANWIRLAIELLEVPEELVAPLRWTWNWTEGTVIAGQPVGDMPCVFLGGLHRAEQVIAGRVLRLINGTLPWPYIAHPGKKALPWIEEKDRADACRKPGGRHPAGPAVQGSW